ncbi:hypothetical protein O7983_000260 [Mycoplasmopsis felis]|uniref:hypothetical protein n=1 Tax=Mycoplasmopsis felis TaxID=33923 RepID=UPI003A4DB3DB
MIHLKIDEWIQIFKSFEEYKISKITELEFESICYKIRCKNWTKYLLKNMLKKRRLYNLNMEI